ncbi:LPXTG cell wall anchor domain-containing protein [Brevibacillus sp. B_LB10_24]|uniref:LPXTG cell wall anchor domain-containing protein n=1 Tax=Brevibacillus sp. B_LB10_24 TaxID=3380645 RepID=UPI0038BA0902
MMKGSLGSNNPGKGDQSDKGEREDRPEKPVVSNPEKPSEPGKVSVKELPQTGEESHLPLQLFGAYLVILGAWFLGRKQFKRSPQ